MREFYPSDYRSPRPRSGFRTASVAKWGHPVYKRFMEVLSISDKVVDLIYSPSCKSTFSHVDFVISCGDLPYYYVEYVLDTLGKDMFFVRGNHASKIEYSKSGNRTGPRGATDLHGRVMEYKGLLMAGVEGSVRYNRGDFQYTQGEMWSHIFRLVPHLLWNRLTQGKYLDIFISHAPPRGIHDKTDPAHRGINAFRWLLKTFKPRFHFHGHIHIYDESVQVETRFESTRVINTYGYRVTNILSGGPTARAS